MAVTRMDTAIDQLSNTTHFGEPVLSCFLGSNLSDAQLSLLSQQTKSHRPKYGHADAVDKRLWLRAIG
jgi:hypothetical protein